MEAFWTYEELKAIVEAARVFFGPNGRDVKTTPWGPSWGKVRFEDAIGLLFGAVTYRWLGCSRGSDPDGFHLERVAGFLRSYLQIGTSPISAAKFFASPLCEMLYSPLGLGLPADCAIFWDYGSLFQRSGSLWSYIKEDDRTEDQRELFVAGRAASTIWYAHTHIASSSAKRTLWFYRGAGPRQF